MKRLRKMFSAGVTVDRGIGFVGHYLKPWCRRTRPRTVRATLREIEENKK